MAQELHEDADHCSAKGMLMREPTRVQVIMKWHMAHSLSAPFQLDFLKLRCRALQQVFGDITGVKGLVKYVKVSPAGETLIDGGGMPIVLEERVVYRHKNCAVLIGWEWPEVDDARWAEIKEGFKDVFAPVALHGGVNCDETDNEVQISGKFMVAEKGGD